MNNVSGPIIQAFPGRVKRGLFFQIPPLRAGTGDFQYPINYIPQGMLSLPACIHYFFNNFPLGIGQWTKTGTLKLELYYDHDTLRFDNHRVGLIPLFSALAILAIFPSSIFKHTLNSTFALASPS